VHNDERLVTIALSLCPRLEPATLRRLVSRFGNAMAVWNADAEQLRGSVQLHDTTLASLVDWRNRFQDVDVERSLADSGMSCILQTDPSYPSQLLDLDEPPLLLFARGQVELLTHVPAIAVVGTRRASRYALEASRWIAQTLAEGGYNVVSGLALGVDTAAHQGALSTRQGATTAVLASGVDICYPSGNTEIYKQISKYGVLLSEYRPGSSVAKYRFPERNRVIAGLAGRLIVVQAGDRSGALITVDHALDLGRDVHVVPGPITSVNYRGSNRLLQQGAEILLDPVDLLTALGTPAGVHEATVPRRWQALYQALATAQNPAAIAGELRRPLSHVYAGLLELELGGWVMRKNGGFYVRTQRYSNFKLN
jgi:DNA processing protein